MGAAIVAGFPPRFPSGRSTGSRRRRARECRVRRRKALGSLGIDIVVEATPVDAPERTLTLERQVVKVADDDTPLPSFTDGFGRSVEVLRLIVTVLLVVMGALVPFIPIVVIVFFGVRLVRRRKQPAPTIEE